MAVRADGSEVARLVGAAIGDRDEVIDFGGLRCWRSLPHQAYAAPARPDTRGHRHAASKTRCRTSRCADPCLAPPAGESRAARPLYPPGVPRGSGGTATLRGAPESAVPPLVESDHGACPLTSARAIALRRARTSPHRVEHSFAGRDGARWLAASSISQADKSRRCRPPHYIGRPGIVVDSDPATSDFFSSPGMLGRFRPRPAQAAARRRSLACHAAWTCPWGPRPRRSRPAQSPAWRR